MTGATTIFVARHGERIDHVDRKWAETAKNPHDPFLTETGVRQAAALGQRLAESGLTYIFSSPFYRTVQTAVEVAKATGVNVKIEPGLSEFLNPEWFPEQPEFRSIEDLKKEFGVIDEDYKPQLIPVYPETRAELIRRAEKIAQLLAEKFSGNILLVAHGIVCEFTVRGITDIGPIPYISYCALQTCNRNDKHKARYSLDGPIEPDLSFMPADIRPVVKTGYR